MNSEKKIKVLVVDDSFMFREVIARGIESDERIEVVAKAIDPYDARDKILEFKPDVMTCDVIMPKMNGIEFIKKLLPQYPIPVIVLSAASDVVFDAMDAGAVDFVSKPDMQSPKSVELFLYDLIEKIKAAAQAKVNHTIQQDIVTSPVECYAMNKIIAIGASTGGTEAICHLLKQLSPKLPGILIVQHIPPMFSNLFAKRLNQQTGFDVKEAQNGDYIESGKVLIAPGEMHMKIKKVNDRYKVNVFSGEKVNGHCPSVDILFESVALEAGKNSVGIILTGMGYDGARGMLAMRRKGARTIGQDEASSVVYGMPKVAYEIGAVEKQVSLNQISSQLSAMLRRE